MKSLEINIPQIVAEVSAIFSAYEDALIINDADVLNELFWQSQHSVRYGVAENLYGFDAIAEYRASIKTSMAGRRLEKSVITTYGTDFATTNTEFHGPDGTGRQSQSWVRTPEGWRIVSAHVSRYLPVGGTSVIDMQT